MNNHQNAIFHQITNFLKTPLALLGVDLKNFQFNKICHFANHPYLCKGLMIYNNDYIIGMANLPDNSVQMILTDPPYLVNYKDRAGRSVANDMASNSNWLTPAFSEMYRVLDNNSYAVVFYGWNEVDKFMNAWRKAGFRIIGHFIFYKKYASNGRKDKKHMEYRHECAYLLAKGYPQPFEVLPSVMGWNYTGNKYHPTQKPIDLLLKLINAFCPIGGVVLDPFMGSASTAMACIKSNIFNYLGYELDNNYFSIAMNRINAKKMANKNQNNYLPQSTNNSHFQNRQQLNQRGHYAN